MPVDQQKLRELITNLDRCSYLAESIESSTVDDIDLQAVGIDDAFITRELPIIINMIDNLPEELTGHIECAHEFNLLRRLLKRLCT